MTLTSYLIIHAIYAIALVIGSYFYYLYKEGYKSKAWRNSSEYIIWTTLLSLGGPCILLAVCMVPFVIWICQKLDNTHESLAKYIADIRVSRNKAKYEYKTFKVTYPDTTYQAYSKCDYLMLTYNISDTENEYLYYLGPYGIIESINVERLENENNLK